jgi:hypothetical protein
LTEFTYSPPESAVFLHTLRGYLQAIGKNDIATLLINATYQLSSSSSFSRVRWNFFNATLRFFVPVANISKFTESVRKELLVAVDSVFPREVGYEIADLEVAPILKAPPDEEKVLSNCGSLVSSS